MVPPQHHLFSGVWLLDAPTERKDPLTLATLPEDNRVPWLEVFGTATDSPVEAVVFPDLTLPPGRTVRVAPPTFTPMVMPRCSLSSDPRVDVTASAHPMPWKPRTMGLMNTDHSLFRSQYRVSRVKFDPLNS